MTSTTKTNDKGGDAASGVPPNIGVDAPPNDIANRNAGSDVKPILDETEIKQPVTALEPNLECEILDQLKQLGDAFSRFPPKLRELGKEIKSVRAAVGERRLENVLKDIADYLVLLGQAERELSEAYDQESLALATMRSLRRQLVQILARVDVQEVVLTSGDDFNQREQRAIGTVGTSEPNEAGKVANVVKPGFYFADKVLAESEVTVYKLAPPKDTVEEGVE